MPLQYPRRYSNPEFLKTISQSNLVKLLQPFEHYLAGRGLQLLPANQTKIDYEALIEILINPDAMTPPELTDCLFYLNEMSTPEIMNELLEEIPPEILQFADGGELTPADVVAQIWLKDRDLLKRKRSEHYQVQSKWFASYQGAEGAVDRLPLVTKQVIDRLQGDIDDWDDKYKRGRGARVFFHMRDSEIWFLVRRGGPFSRVAAVEGGRSTSVCYRPEKFDLVIYGRDLDSLAVNASTPGHQELYREIFGKHLFGDAKYFRLSGRYSLDRLRELGEDALNCSKASGIKWIGLTEVEIAHGNGVTVGYSGPDLFCTMGRHMREILAAGFISKLSFAVEFCDSKTARPVSVWQPSLASYVRDEDRLLFEAWMLEQGFLTRPAEAADDQADAALAGF
jgi:hypothetical protein